MSICMRCGTTCTCHRHGSAPEELFYICTNGLNYPPDHKGKCMELIRQVLDDHCAYKVNRALEDGTHDCKLNIYMGGKCFVCGHDTKLKGK